MASENPTRFLDKLKADLGDALRVVAEYDQDDYQFLHRRDDITDLYTPEDIEKIFDDMVIQSLGRDYLEQLFHAGNLECTLYTFSDAVVCHFVENETSGLVVSFDKNADISLVKLIQICKSGVTS